MFPDSIFFVLTGATLGAIVGLINRLIRHFSQKEKKKPRLTLE